MSPLTSLSRPDRPCQQTRPRDKNRTRASDSLFHRQTRDFDAFSTVIDARPLIGEGIELHVRGVDMLDGTPILAIKPYLSSIPPERLRRGWLAEAEARQRR